MSPKSSNPYLSIIATSRNDEHGGDMLKRMKIFVAGLIHQCNSFHLPCELIMVEWNPIKEKPFLIEILPGTNEQDYLKIRYIRVPNEIHEKLAFAKQIPLFQMIAKNVGIRRASAKFVLCTNTDLIFSDELFRRIAQRDLKEDSFYRANRCDVPNTLDENWSFEKKIAFCKSNIKIRLGKNAVFPNFSSANGTFLKYEKLWPALAVLAKVKSVYANSIEDRFNELDLEACGDFTLMTKKNWFDVQAYPELEIYSIHLDSMGIMAASALGLKQMIFQPSECTYHLEHTGGWEFSNPIEKINFFTKKPMLDWWAVREAGLYLLKNKTKFNLNKEHWGLANHTLEEV